ncbi:hypothetical protein ACU4HD_01115 [Cupriavidus basilensis]
MFPFWDWVGGRFSLWSAVGLSIVLAVGLRSRLPPVARRRPRHGPALRRDRRAAENMPMILGLLDRLVSRLPRRAEQPATVAPYCAPLELLTDFMQQLEMESNGKSVPASTGAAIDTDTGAHRLGYRLAPMDSMRISSWSTRAHRSMPVDFITTLGARAHALPGHHAKLLANCFAQGEALLRGRTAGEVRALGGSTDEALVPHMVFEGNRPSTYRRCMERLDAASLWRR